MIKKGLLCLLSLAVSIVVLGCEVKDKQYYDMLTYDTDSGMIPTEEKTEIPTEPKSTADSESSVIDSLESVSEQSDDKPAKSLEEFKNNAALIGDSIASGFGAYDRMPMNHCYAMQSIGLSNIREATFSSEYGELGIMDILSNLQPEDIIVSMGMNDALNNDPQQFADDYRTFTDEILAVCPDANIYVLGITPVQYDVTYTSNENIDAHNAQLAKKFKDDKQVHYVQAGDVLKDSDGNLDTSYSGGDGIHLCGEAYDLLLEEIGKNLAD